MELGIEELGLKTIRTLGSLSAHLDHGLIKAFSSYRSPSGDVLLQILDTIIEEPEDAKATNFPHEAIVELQTLCLISCRDNRLRVHEPLSVFALKKRALQTRAQMDDIKLNMRAEKV